MRLILPLLSLTAAAVSLLRIVRAPDYIWTWKLAVLAGEFGHWLVLLPLGLAAAACFGPAGAGRVITLALCAGATAGFLRPVFLAGRLAQSLPPGLQAAFGDGNRKVVFDYGRLYLGAAAPAPAVTTEIFARPDGQELKLDFYRPGSAKDTLERPAGLRGGDPWRRLGRRRPPATRGLECPARGAWLCSGGGQLPAGAEMDLAGAAGRRAVGDRLAQGERAATRHRPDTAGVARPLGRRPARDRGRLRC